MPNLTVSGNVDTMLGAADNAAIRSAIGVGTTDAPTFLAQTLTGQSLTGTQATSLVDLSTTWLSTTGTPTAIKLNVTDTASNAASNLMDLQVGGVSKVSVRKDGNLKVLGSAGVHSTSYLTNDGTSGNTDWGTYLRNDQGLALKSTNALSWTSGAATLTRTLLLEQDAAGILAQRNGVLAQAFRAYNTFTDPSNKEWGEFDWKTTANTLRIGTNHFGSGVARPIDFVTGGVVRMSIGAGGLVTVNTIGISKGTGTGTVNIAIGSGLQSNTSGDYNSALGASALQNNTGGNNNSAVGVSALQNNTGGSTNSAIGQQALFFNSTGNLNTAIGASAGKYISGGATPNTTATNSLFLGVDTRALADGQTNQTVIGFSATGSGSNSTTLNHTSATLTKINGTSAHVLDVTGTIKLSPPASVTPANNGELMVEATSNTTLTFKFKGSDGTVRSGTVILA